jgi:hypothetical protein
MPLRRRARRGVISTVRRFAIAAGLCAGACGDNVTPGDAAAVRPDGGAPAVDIGASVLEMHGGPRRLGTFVAPNLTHAAAATLHVDQTFAPLFTGLAYAQPLFVDGMGGRDLLLVATEADQVSAFDAADGSMMWQRTLGSPQPMPDPADGAPCGRINPMGITDTPVVDFAARTMFFDAMIRDNNAAHHRIYALSIDDGSTQPGYPIDVGTAISANGVAFLPAPQGSRGALTRLADTVFVPYGGLNGDCGTYHGWVVAVPEHDPAALTSFVTSDLRAGIWNPGGVSSDGTSVFAVTGNGEGGATWGDSEAVLRLRPDATFSGAANDYWAPSNWQQLDALDLDLGGSPALVVDVPGATPSALLAAFGKDGNVYLLDREHLGGIRAPLASLAASTTAIINAPASYRTALGTYLVFRGHGVASCPGVTTTSNLIAVRIEPSSPPTLTLAWCSGAGGGKGSPIATTIDGTNEAIVWYLGTADIGDGRLHGFDGDTGAVVFAGGGPNDIMYNTVEFVTPIYAKGTIYIAGGQLAPPMNGQLFALRPN